MIFNVLVACEESQRVCTAFRELGHTAFSCDIQEESGGHPEWHICDDVLKVLHGGEFQTTDGIVHNIQKWDIVIAFPPCTHLAVSGARHFDKKRADGRQREGIEFFCQFLDIDCEYVCIENPVNIISGNYVKQHFPDLAEKYHLPRKPSQTIEPYWFGTPVRKKTCYWLKGLPELIPTDIVEPDIREYIKKDGRKTTFSANFCVGKGSHTSRQRSKTPPGVAKAMAEQWTEYIKHGEKQLSFF